MYKEIKCTSTSQSILKLTDLYGKPLIGQLIAIDTGKFSYIYVFETDDIQVKLFGSKSLNQYLNPQLIDKFLKVECTEVKYLSNGNAYGIAKVSEWVEEEVSDDELPLPPDPNGDVVYGINIVPKQD